MSKRILLVLILFILTTSPVFALDLQTPNNKFGIHLAQPDPDDLKKASNLVNVSGGKWGYVTLVIQENDRDGHKWQDVFNHLRELHLIPITRLATAPVGDNWRKPDKDDVDGWVSFLDSLNWVVKDRYIILFNETNHGTEWGGSVDPTSYAEIAQLMAEKLKAKNPDYFIMLAGLDASAPEGLPRYMDEGSYLRAVVGQIGADKFNQLFDGLSSHSYPNPGFAGSPLGSGRISIRGYQWEQAFLEGMGVKQLPVFITETGWDASAVSREKIALNFQTVYEQVWLADDTVVAVTPFILNYQSAPFTNFSWAIPGNGEYYPQYYLVQSLAKVTGEPVFNEKGSVSYSLPRAFVVNSKYYYQIRIKNTGQAIWDEADGYHFEIDGYPLKSYFFLPLHHVKPFEDRTIDFWFRTPKSLENFDTRITLYRHDQKVMSGPNWKFEVVPLPSIDFSAHLHPKLSTSGDDFEIQVFDRNEKLVFDQKHVKVADGKGSINEIQNITLGDTYRIVILKPYYLPRQAHLEFHKGRNPLTFHGMYPLDFNNNGALDFWDPLAGLLHPSLWLNYWPF